MSKLNEKLVKKLLDCSTKEKEEIGNRIVKSLGGDAKKTVTNLPKRKGNQDGGIDGRVLIYSEIKITHKRPNGEELYTSEIQKIEDKAAFNIKIEKDKFDRSNFATFLHDMERETIFTGIIISASGLSQDSIVELKRINAKGKFKIYHFSLEDILDGHFECDLEFKTELNVCIKNSIKDHINND